MGENGWGMVSSLNSLFPVIFFFNEGSGKGEKKELRHYFYYGFDFKTI